ncbi:membrane protease subunit [Streptomyces sp. JH14]|uniref:SPFH domain-containing protein n=1 Tax=Streptomyces sp. JH14 TaxID=2793630 RepID=UPI0023F705FB|nr:SPFH domain-containing protein [Streptomyces sp. JH14]MDF6042643.1 membrane protease subunit [Streptomyces sp. JH14]
MNDGEGSGCGVGPGAGLVPGPGPEPGGGAGGDFRTGSEPGATGSESVVDLVLDLVPGEADDSAFGAASASVSVPSVPASSSVPAVEGSASAASVPASSSAPAVEAGPAQPSGRLRADRPSPDAAPSITASVRSGPGRRQGVIANEHTTAIPVHLLFRDDPEGADAAELPAGLAQRPGGEEQVPGVRRPPGARGGQVQAPTRPAPAGDPCLAERPGPVLPGWLALLAGLAGSAAAGAVLWWAGALPRGVLARAGIGARPYDGIGLGTWAVLVLLAALVLFALGGLGRGRVGYAWVVTLFGDYRGSVRRTGLVWVSPLLLRRRVDVRLRHWRSEPLPAVDANGTALRVVVLVVWRIRDTVRATLGVANHEEYLREQVESAMARVLSQLPADAFHEDAHTLRNAEAVGDALTRMLKADCEPVGIEVYSAQPTGIEYAPEVAAAMQRRRIAAIDAKHRDSVLTSVVDAVDDTVNRLTARGLVELDDYERKALVKDLTVAFYTGRSGGEGS